MKQIKKFELLRNTNFIKMQQEMINVSFKIHSFFKSKIEILNRKIIHFKKFMEYGLVIF